jgi:hypothetical protein
MKVKPIIAGMILALLCGCPGGAGAFYSIAISDQGPRPICFFTNNHVDWSSLGLAGTELGSGIGVNAANYGTRVTVSTSTGTNLRRMDQIPPIHVPDVGNWSGNFAPGDALLWTNNVNNAELILDFSTEIFGGIAQLQTKRRGDFEVSILAFDAGGRRVNLDITATGTSTGAADNSAIYIGTATEHANIRRLVFIVRGTTPNDFAINRLDFLQCPPP